MTIDGTAVSLGPSAVVIGGVTHSFALSTVQGSDSAVPTRGLPAIVGGAAPTFTFGGSTITAKPVPGFVIGGQTVTPGGSPVTVSGTVISVPSSPGTIVVGGKSIAIAAPAGAVALTTAGQTITVIPNTVLAIGGKTLNAGGPAITVDGTRLSLAPSATAFVVGTSTQLGSSGGGITAFRAPLITIGSQTFTANAATQYYVAPGETLTPGGQVVVSGTTVSLGPSASRLVVNGVTQTLSPPYITPAPLLTVGGTVYSPNSGSTYVIGGQVLTPGGSIVASGTTISLASGVSSVVINGVAQTLAAPTGFQVAGAPLLTIGGTTYSANSGSSYVINGQTLTPGGVVTLSGGTTLSLAPSASDLVIDGVTSSIPAQPTITAPAILTIDGQTITAAAGAGTTYLISGQVLTPGGAVTFKGPNGLETVSLASGGTAIVDVVSGATTTSTIPSAFGVAETAAPILTIGGETFTALPGAGPSYLIHGQTLTPGGVITETVSGHTYVVSLSPTATVLEIEEEGAGGKIISTELETLFPATVTGGRGTAFVTTDINGAGKTTTVDSGASATGGGGGNAQQSAGLQDAATLNRVGYAAMAGIVGILALAIWL